MQVRIEHLMLDGGGVYLLEKVQGLDDALRCILEARAFIPGMVDLGVRCLTEIGELGADFLVNGYVVEKKTMRGL